MISIGPSRREGSGWGVCVEIDNMNKATAKQQSHEQRSMDGALKGGYDVYDR